VIEIDNIQRGEAGKKAAVLAIAGNIFLTILNIAVGIISGSYALIAEGTHTLSDITTSIIAYIGFRLGQKPPDREHPLGHGRAEAIAGLIIVIFLTLVAYEIISGAVDKLFFSGILNVPSYLAGIMALIGIFINIAMTKYIIKVGKDINSPAIVADGKHQQTDILSCIAILFSVALSQIGYTFLDPIIGLVIGLFVLKTAFDIGKDNINNIMGKIPSEDLLNHIKEIAKSVQGVYGVHDVKINYFGSYATLAMHIDVEPNLSLKESHKIAHSVQNKTKEDIDIIQSVIAHTCPYDEEYEHG